MFKDKTVSIVMPCLNEEKFIGRCLDSLLANDYNKKLLEILVVDGMSQDKTREILADYCTRWGFIKVLDNPKKITPAALNIGIKASKADIIVRVEHVLCAKLHHHSRSWVDKYQADNTGGIRKQR
jgi:glycosyltransferase involved in cell wall biosynthesis